ncbi:MAG: hypothetical protein DMF83_26620, partial [Acidobacteria bacterium]
FTIGTAELSIGREDTSGGALTTASSQKKITFGDILEFDDLRIGVNNFEVNFDATNPVVFNGSIFVASGGAKFFPGRPFSAELKDRQTADDVNADGTPNDEAVRLQLTFSQGKVSSFQFQVDTMVIHLSSFVTLTATDLRLDTGAAANQELISFQSIGAVVRIGSMELGGEARNFAFMGDGSFKTKPGFGIFLTVGSATGSSFKWPEWLPVHVNAVGIEWADIQNHPEDFIITLSLSVTGIKGIGGLSFSGAIEGVKISPKLLLEGKFPIIDVASIGVSVKGKLFGGDLEAGLIGGILKLDKNFAMIGPFDSTTPVAQRIFFVGVQGSFSLGGVGGFSIRFALSELGPIGIFISASLPTGIVVYAPAGLTINDFAAGVEFFKTLPSIEDPFALRNPEFGLPTELTAEQWLDSVKQQVAAQAKQLAANPNLNGFTAAFTSPMVITGSAKLYTLYASKQVFNAQVVIKISTDGKFLIIGKLNFANDSVSISGRLYADLSNVTSGKVVVLFLADVPDQVRLLTLYGKLKTGFRNASGEEVTFDVVDAAPPTPTATKPAARVIDPVQSGGSVDVNTVNSADHTSGGQRFVDVSFDAPPGATLDYASILDNDAELAVSANGTSVPVTGKPKPLDTIMTDSGPIAMPLELETVDGVQSVTRLGPSRQTVVRQGAGGVDPHATDAQLLAAVTNPSSYVDLRVESISVEQPPAGSHVFVTVRAVTALAKETVVQKKGDLASASDDQLLVAAIGKIGTNRFRYLLGDATTPFPKFSIGTVTVTFNAGSFKNADVTLENGNVVAGAANDQIVATFSVEGATATLTDPGAGGTIDINAINDRNYIDVAFVAPTSPTALAIDEGSVTDLTPEFTLTGDGLGSAVLDDSRAPAVLVGTSTNTKTFRYWLTGTFAASGKVTLTMLPDTWAVNVTDFDLTHAGDDLPASPTVPDLAGTSKAITLGGTTIAGDWILNVDGNEYKYAAQAADTPSKVALELAAKIDPVVGFTAGSEDATLVITKPGGGRFNLTTTAPNGATADVSDVTVATKSVVVSGGVTNGETWTVTVAGTAYNYTVTAADHEANDIARGLAAAIDGPATGFVATAEDNTLVVTKVDGSAFVLRATAPQSRVATTTQNIFALGDPEQFLTVVFPVADDGKEIVDSSITDGDAEITLDPAQGGRIFDPVTMAPADWTVTLDPTVAPTKVTDTIYRYKVNVNPGTSLLSRVIVEYRFLDGTWNERNKSTGVETPIVIANKDANPATPPPAIENINDPSTNPNLRQPFSLGANLPSVLHVTIPDVPAGFPPGFKLDPASVTDAGPEFNIVVANGNWTVEFDPSRAAVQIGTSNAFDFPIIVTLPDNPSRTVTLRADFLANAWAYTGPIMGGTQPGETRDLGNLSATNNRTFVDVTFAPSAGSTLVTPSIDGGELAFTGFGGSGVTLTTGAPLHVGDRTFRYLLTGDFIAGEVTVNFAADQWTDSGGIKNRAFTQTFTVQGTRGDLVKRTMVPVLDANGNPTGTQTEVITSL